MRETLILQLCYRLTNRETPTNTYSQSYPHYPQLTNRVFHMMCINIRSFGDNFVYLCSFASVWDEFVENSITELLQPIKQNDY